VRRDYAGPVVIGEDLTTIDLERRMVTFAGLHVGLGRAQSGGSSP
jgi:hypothetical protein